MKFLITGANGQLATEFQRNIERNNSCNVIPLSREKLDITDFNAVAEAILHYKPDIVLNCAAYNQVDKAEQDFERASKVNATGVKNLAALCCKNRALLIHFSTDYVFDGLKEGFYTEDDMPNPINNYGRSKLLGEKLLAEETDDFLLFRVSWVFGCGRQNFLYKLLELAKRNRVLKIAADQVSVPTYTEDIVKVTMAAVENGVRGLYHLTNNGYASRYEVARYYVEKARLPNVVLPVSSDFFPTIAKRPYFSAMSNIKLSQTLKQEIPDWQDAMDRFMRRGGK